VLNLGTLQTQHARIEHNETADDDEGGELAFPAVINLGNGAWKATCRESRCGKPNGGGGVAVGRRIAPDKKSRPRAAFSCRGANRSVDVQRTGRFLATTLLGGVELRLATVLRTMTQSR
jgi:hypothetical protein